MEQHRPELNRAKSRIRIDNMTPDEEKCQGVVTTVESKEEAEKLRLWQQGDEEMYTVQSVQARYENRFDPEVVSVIMDDWWPAALQYASESGDVGSSTKDIRRTWTLPRYNHFQMLTRQIKALLEPHEAWDEVESQRLAQAAWESDCNKEGRLTRTLFCDSIFELADTYTLTTEASEYVEFLRKLLEAVAHMDRWKSYGEILRISAKPPVQEERQKRRNGHKRRRAAVVIQNTSRRKGAQTTYQVKRNASIKIQAVARRKGAQTTYQAKRQASVKIQRIARGKKDRTRVQNKRLAASMNASAALSEMQALVREREGRLTSMPRRPPRLEQDSRYRLPKLRPPSSRWKRQLISTGMVRELVPGTWDGEWLDKQKTVRPSSRQKGITSHPPYTAKPRHLRLMDSPRQVGTGGFVSPRPLKGTMGWNLPALQQPAATARAVMITDRFHHRAYWRHRSGQ